MSTDREKFEALLRESPAHNNQMLKRHALDSEKYQYDSVQFAYECFLAARASESEQPTHWMPLPKPPNGVSNGN